MLTPANFTLDPLELLKMKLFVTVIFLIGLVAMVEGISDLGAQEKRETMEQLQARSWNCAWTEGEDQHAECKDWIEHWGCDEEGDVYKYDINIGTVSDNCPKSC